MGYRRKQVAALLPVLGLLGAGLTAPRTVRANTGTNFLETIGISVAVGTVLGASTLPFYSQPGKHLMNLAYGASAGAVVGVGIFIYLLIDDQAGSGRSNGQDGYNRGYSALEGDTKPFAGHPRLFQSTTKSSDSGQVLAFQPATNSVPNVTSGQFWMPVVSLNW